MKLSPSELLVLQTIQQSGGISRKTVADKTGLSQASITKISKMLLEQRFIVEGNRIGSGQGRKEVLLYPNPDKFYFLGIDIGGYRVRLALADYNLEISHEHEYLMTEFDEREDVLQELMMRIDAFLNESGRTHIDAIGIGVTGIVDSGRSRILNIPNCNGWDNLNIVHEMERRYRCPVYLEESGRAMACGEKILGKARDIEDFIVVHIAFGVVAGVFINGQPLRGFNNVAGLLGHITVDDKTYRCLCGNYGCLETTVTYPMLEEEYRNKQGDGPRMLDAYGMNNKNALDVCITAGKSIGVVLSNVINLFNPAMVFVGGPVFDHFPLIFEEVKRTILLRANRFATVGMKLAKSSFHDRQGIMGALALAGSRCLTEEIERLEVRGS
ncbi:ROK family transcriptional regulator [Paenibacillus spongiae]|uniref:ROK family transcriptional regulator n=1 Tax=Paenibacillus spongiae TaxID=2909671 RepID=A0ABY5S4K9_9BACL|nr:ROK family transcriptional regulator [Paenibacillus spongiae]UVI27775.1 ROK family transcriptional regulator [Paenibacillus spongiae]